MTSLLPEEAILGAGSGSESSGSAEILGHSRQGRAVIGHCLGSGHKPVSLIAGCHSDEPVGPELLRRFVTFLQGLPSDDEVLTRWKWAIVPDANPDGAAQNTTWIERKVEARDALGRSDQGYDLASYFLESVRELPGADVEFGFPRDENDLDVRPENLAIAHFLDREGPMDLHISFHGMGFAAGPWFLVDHSWANRTESLQRNLTTRVRAMGYRLHDVDRKGEKGFHRISEGFTTRPDSRSMIQHFLDLHDPRTAALFRPSSMEHVRRLGHDTLTLVSEMPLFLLPTGQEASGDGPPMPTGTEARLEFFAWGRSLIEGGNTDRFRSEVRRIGIRPMPISDQMRLQLAFLAQGLEALESDDHGIAK